MRGYPGMAGTDESIIEPVHPVGYMCDFGRVHPRSKLVKRFVSSPNSSLSSNCCIVLFNDMHLPMIIKGKEARHLSYGRTVRIKNDT